jgi:hypothetical protein
VEVRAPVVPGAEVVVDRPEARGTAIAAAAASWRVQREPHIVNLTAIGGQPVGRWPSLPFNFSFLKTARGISGVAAGDLLKLVAAEAHEASEAGHTQGKIVLEVSRGLMSCCSAPVDGSGPSISLANAPPPSGVCSHRPILFQREAYHERQ